MKKERQILSLYSLKRFRLKNFIVDVFLKKNFNYKNIFTEKSH